MIYTTYFAKLKKLPENVIPIAICSKVPEGYSGFHFRSLAPRFDFFTEWKRTEDNDYFIKCYNEQVLATLDVHSIVPALHGIADGKDVALVCYEKSTDFCHRHLIAEWLRAAGYKCEELT